MALAALIAGLVASIVVLRGLSAERHAYRVIKVAQDALGVITDPDLSDEAKEKQVQHASFVVLKHFLVLLGIAAAACLSAAVFVLCGGWLGLFSIAQAMALASSGPFLLWSSLGAVLLWLLAGKLGIRGPRAVAEADAQASRAEVPYSPLDKALHNFAFSSPARQIALSSLEDRFWKRTLAATQAQHPVFITSLPRAGTTILLHWLHGQAEFASATYRNMPFTMAPLLWGRLSRGFRKPGQKAERAHGDGIAVDFDSPEAFEEMIWMAFWRNHYGKRQILLWRETDRDAAFEAFLFRHMCKIVASVPNSRRYVSKNNANIARLPLLAAAFPDARILIPIRHPASQAASLMRQHRRFSDLHARDRFARQYMEGIGHFEFGAALRPIAFAGAPDSAEGAEHIDYWLRYWIAAYEHVLASAPASTVFVDHDALSQAPAAHLPDLARMLGLSQCEPGARALDLFRAPGPVPDLPDASHDLMRRAHELHAELVARARR